MLKVKKWARDVDMRKEKFIKRSDLEIREAIEDAFLYDPRLLSFDINIDVDSGLVVLRGVVDNLQSKIAAERDALNTTGVISVSNLIKVEPIDDFTEEKIRKNVKNALLFNSITESYEIKVSVNDNTVTLDGVVDSFTEKSAAENTAFRANGVTRVKNNLKVKNTGVITHNPYVDDGYLHDYRWLSNVDIISTMPDSELKKSVQGEFLWSPYVDGDDINISVNDGVVTLKGDVHSWNEYYAAEENAYEGGAIGVVNKLRVKL